MSQDDAALQADHLLKLLVQHQSQLFTLQGNHSQGGEELGEAIAALRLKLIEMYKTQP